MSNNLDINWYFLDRNMHMICVASGGGELPQFVAEAAQRNDSIHSAFIESTPLFESERNPNLTEYINLSNIDSEQYYETFDFIARLGFYAFDKINISDPTDKRYILVAYPKLPNSGVFPIHFLGMVSNLIKQHPRKFRKIINSFPVLDVEIVKKGSPATSNRKTIYKPVNFVAILKSLSPQFLDAYKKG
jgi:hypothetical protein